MTSIRVAEALGMAEDLKVVILLGLFRLLLLRCANDLRTFFGGQARDAEVGLLLLGKRKGRQFEVSVTPVLQRQC